MWPGTDLKLRKRIKTALRAAYSPEEIGKLASDGTFSIEQLKTEGHWIATGSSPSWKNRELWLLFDTFPGYGDLARPYEFLYPHRFKEFHDRLYLLLVAGDFKGIGFRR
jgi:hypothetical protein